MIGAKLEKLEICYVVNKRGDNFHLAIYERPLRKFNQPFKKGFQKKYTQKELEKCLHNLHARGIYNYNALYNGFLQEE